MADRKQFLDAKPAREDFLTLLERSKETRITEDMLHEQRVSFAFGNAPDSDQITKDSVRRTSHSIRLISE